MNTPKDIPTTFRMESTCFSNGTMFGLVRLSSIPLRPGISRIPGYHDYEPWTVKKTSPPKKTETNLSEMLRDCGRSSVKNWSDGVVSEDAACEARVASRRP